MSNEEFWYGKPKLAKAYREAHEIRNEMHNQQLWMQGMYNYRAFSSVAESVVSGLSGGKGNKPSKYPENPFPITEREQKAELERRKQKTLAWVEANQ